MCFGLRFVDSKSMTPLLGKFATDRSEAGGSVLCGFLGLTMKSSTLSCALFHRFSVLMGGERKRELGSVSFVSFSWFHCSALACICGTP